MKRPMRIMANLLIFSGRNLAKVAGRGFESLRPLQMSLGKSERYEKTAARRPPWCPPSARSGFAHRRESVSIFFAPGALTHDVRVSRSAEETRQKLPESCPAPRVAFPYGQDVKS